VTRLACLCALLLPLAAVAADPPKPVVLVKDLPNITAVCVTPDGRTFVGQAIGPAGVYEVKDGKAAKFADANVSYGGMVAYQQWLFVSDGGGVHRVELATGKSEVWAAREDFPDKIGIPGELAVDERGVVYVLTHATTARDNLKGLYSIAMKPGPRGKPPVRGNIKKVADVMDARGLLTDGMNHLLFTRGKPQGKNDSIAPAARQLVRLKIADGSEEVAQEFELPGSGDDLPRVRAVCTDLHGRQYLLSASGVWGIARPGEKPVKIADMWGDRKGVLSMAYDPATRQLLLGDQEQKALVAIPAQIPGWEVDESPLPVEAELAFADVKWTGWDDGSATGRSNPLRPILLTHAGDGSGRTFMATQHGVIHIIEKGAKESKVFLDIQNKCLYKDNENEQGLLGLAFHPNYKANGEFFVFYTDKAKKLENVVCRFRVSKDDPNKADPASEQELLRISHKYWNHDGGTVCFGPDGHLYVVLGDGGSANDPDDHGQKTDVLLGKILRIDVNAKGDTTAYAIPKDNPFVGNGKYRPEIYALGVRNPWRMSFDRKTGRGWFGEVGQNLWEEINLLEKGANYGWRRRESFHPFGADGSGPKKEFTDPIWEYHHDVGKSITGGHVYRGKELPPLDGYYLYADYVSGKVWGLKYDETTKRVTANRPIKSSTLPIMSFGEDEAGEVYMMTYSASGKGVYKFKATK
jgi:glucose/arabinose dehydrogenase